MQVTVTTLSDKVFTIEVSEDLELENFKALCEFETGIPARETAILLNGRPLRDDKASLKSYGIGHNDILLLQHMRGVTGLTLPTNAPFSTSTSQRSPGHGGPGKRASHLLFLFIVCLLSFLLHDSNFIIDMDPPPIQSVDRNVVIFSALVKYYPYSSNPTRIDFGLFKMQSIDIRRAGVPVSLQQLVLCVCVSARKKSIIVLI